MVGNAIKGIVQNALDSNMVGTPNLLLQTDLTEVPIVNILPLTLAPAIMFEGSFGVATNQTITLQNTGTNPVTFQVKATKSCE